MESKQIQAGSREIDQVPEEWLNHFRAGDLRFGYFIEGLKILSYGDGWGEMNLYCVTVYLKTKTYTVEFSYAANARHDKKTDEISYNAITDVPATLRQIKELLHNH